MELTLKKKKRKKEKEKEEEGWNGVQVMAGVFYTNIYSFDWRSKDR